MITAKTYVLNWYLKLFAQFDKPVTNILSILHSRIDNTSLELNKIALSECPLDGVPHIKHDKIVIVGDIIFIVNHLSHQHIHASLKNVWAIHIDFFAKQRLHINDGAVMLITNAQYTSALIDLLGVKNTAELDRLKPIDGGFNLLPEHLKSGIGTSVSCPFKILCPQF